MARNRKCKQCGKLIMVNEEEYEIEKRGKSSYAFHLDCKLQYECEKVEKEIERAELDELVEYIKDVYNVISLPSQCFPYINDLRSGSVLFGKIKKKVGQGYTYPTILETYKEATESILWAKENKDFKNFMQEFKYGMAIVRNKIIDVDRRLKEEAKNEAREKRSVIKEMDVLEVDFSKLKKQAEVENEIDISSFLDDEDGE